MTREENIERLRTMKAALIFAADATPESQEMAAWASEAINGAISALKGPTREQVENVWKGKWEPGNPICPICGKNKFDGLDADIWADWMPNFCPHCGAPMTGKAVDMVMERLEALRDE